MSVLIIGSFLNVIFDPWFIYGGFGVPAMGIAGVAVATVLIQFVGACFLGYRVHRTGIIAKEDLREMIPRWKPMREIARQGLPATMTLLTVALGFLIITFFVSTFGKEAVAAYGISIRIEQIALLPTIGLNVATLTIVAQNNGARLFHRITETLSRALGYGIALMAAGTVLLFAGAPALVGFFTADETVIAIGTMYLRIAAFVLYAYVILYVNVAALQGVKKPLFAVWIGLARQIAAPAVVFYSLIHIFNWGISGIWWGIFMINWCAALATYAYTRHALRMITRGGAGG
jgi:putative MATE family efflux protein